MEGIISTFGIDWRLLFLQGVNFGLLMAGLWYFLYAPMMKTLETRRKTVSKGVIDAKHAEEKLKEVEVTRVKTLSEAGKEADAILSHAQMRAAEKEREILAHAQASATAALSEAEALARETKNRAVLESKEEVAKLIVLGMEKMLSRSTNSGQTR